MKQQGKAGRLYPDSSPGYLMPSQGKSWDDCCASLLHWRLMLQRAENYPLEETTKGSDEKGSVATLAMSLL